MQYLLTSKFGFRPENMRLLLDDNPDPRQHPTRQNMLEGFAWLVQGCQPGDSLFFHYSGLSPATAFFLSKWYSIPSMMETDRREQK